MCNICEGVHFLSQFRFVQLAGALGGWQPGLRDGYSPGRMVNVRATGGVAPEAQQHAREAVSFSLNTPTHNTNVGDRADRKRNLGTH